MTWRVVCGGPWRAANGKLKHVITQMRSTRHFCIDVILIFIILGRALQVGICYVGTRAGKVTPVFTS